MVKQIPENTETKDDSHDVCKESSRRNAALLKALKRKKVRTCTLTLHLDS